MVVSCVKITPTHNTIQDSDFENVIKFGRPIDSFFCIKPNGLMIEEYNEWNNGNQKYYIINTNIEYKKIFGNFHNYVTSIFFIPISEKAAYEKRIEMRNAKTLPERITIRKKYPDYKINDMTDEEIGNCFFTVPPNSNRKEIDTKLVVDFIIAFPEYKNHQKLKEISFVALGNNYRLFLTIFEDTTMIYTKLLEFLERNYIGNLRIFFTVKEFIDISKDTSYIKNRILGVDGFPSELVSLAECLSLFSNDSTNFIDKYRQLIEKMNQLETHSGFLGLFSYKTLKYTLSATDIITFVKISKEYDLVGKQLLKYVWNVTNINNNFWNTIVDGLSISEYGILIRDEVDSRRKQEEQARQAREQEYKEKLCAQCKIDYNKSNMPSSEIKDGFLGEYTETKPGKIVMEIGNENEFYYDSKNKQWYTYGFLFVDKRYSTFDEMLEDFLKKCKDRYCK
jgi:hypothetical protein